MVEASLKKDVKITKIHCRAHYFCSFPFPLMLERLKTVASVLLHTEEEVHFC